MMENNKRIGFIGFGEVAYNYAKRLKQLGWEVFIYDYRYDEISEKADQKRQKAKELDVEYVPSLEKLVDQSLYILSTVTPSSSTQIAKAVAPLVSNKHIFLDLNTTDPKLKIENSNYFSQTECVYLDGVIMGSPKQTGLETPLFYSGKIDLQHSVLTVFNLKKVGENIGQASAIKICQSIITKGLQCLIWEQMLLAKKWGVQMDVSENLNRIFNNRSYSEWCEYAITSSAIHSKRRAQEMEMVAGFLKEMDLISFQSEASQNTLQWVSEQNLDQSLIANWSSQRIVDFVSSKLNLKGASSK